MLVKQLGHEGDYPLKSSAEAKNPWSYTSTSPYGFHGMVLSYTQLHIGEAFM